MRSFARRSTSTGVAAALAACHAAPPDAIPRAPVAAPLAAPGPAPVPAEPVPLGPLPADVHPLREALDLDVDPAAAGFRGTAAIRLHLDRARDRIWLHGLGLAIDQITLERAGAPPLAGVWDEADPSGVARVTLPALVRGDVTLTIAYHAAYDPGLVGVYKTQGRTQAAVFSKFEAIYARRAFPCVDEPGVKIPFDVALTVPAAAVALGNMPVVERRPARAGFERVRFATTPPLPTYLVAFAVGPFDTRAAAVPPDEVRAQPLPLGGVALAGRGDDTAYALADEPALLAAQERYFGIAFPFPKLDLIAVPDFQSGAMENAGAITFRDAALLVDPKVTSLAQRIGVSSTVAHETAHQWFGDLVTMRWWDDLWLNEGFATFLATKTLRAVHPDFDAELAAVASTDAVMNLDSLASARRVRQPIASTHDITNAFDGITYQKGAAILTMLEHSLGVEPFRAAIHAYLLAHAGGNATTDDLVRALSAQAGHDLAPLAASFLDQPGVPVVAVASVCAHGQAHLELAQARWRPLGTAATDDPLWSIPVCVRTDAGEACTVLATRTATLPLAACPAWVMPNAGAAGYYRFTQPPAELARLRDRGTPKLATVERLALATDLDAAFRSGALPAAEVLRALAPLACDAHGTVAAAPLGVYGFLDDYMVTGAARATLRARVVRQYAPAVAALGWAAAAGDPPWRRLFRANLYAFVALRLEDRALLADAARRGRALLGLAAGGAPADPDLDGVALAAAARTGDAQVWGAILARLDASADAQLRGRLLTALASTREPALVTRALDLALDPRLRANERLTTLAALLGAQATRDQAWAWLGAHVDALLPLLPDRYGGELPRLWRICDATRTEALRAFFAPRVEKLTGGPRNLALALETAQQCTARVAAQQASVDAWIARP